jgi:hypothetical protein
LYVYIAVVAEIKVKFSNSIQFPFTQRVSLTAPWSIVDLGQNKYNTNYKNKHDRTNAHAHTEHSTTAGKKVTYVTDSAPRLNV